MNNHLEIWYPHNLKNCDYQCDALKYKRLKKSQELVTQFIGTLEVCKLATQQTSIFIKWGKYHGLNQIYK